MKTEWSTLSAKVLSSEMIGILLDLINHHVQVSKLNKYPKQQ